MKNMPKKKILIIPVGGTICSLPYDVPEPSGDLKIADVSEPFGDLKIADVPERGGEASASGELRVAACTGSMLEQNFYNSDFAAKDDVVFEHCDNLGVLSENMTIDCWNTILDVYRKKMGSTLANAPSKYDGVIVLHGTDTLAYSCAMFSLLWSHAPMPIFFVSANRPLTSPQSNANANFRAAVELIFAGITPNVYAVYKNPTDSKTYLHFASQLEQCRNYSEDFFSADQKDITGFLGTSLLANYISEYNKLSHAHRASQSVLFSFCQTPCDAGVLSERECFNSVLSEREWFNSVLSGRKLKDCVLLLNPYVGLNYAGYNFSEYACVLHGTYHSGTACVDALSEQAGAEPECARAETESAGVQLEREDGSLTEVKRYDKHSVLYMLTSCFTATPSVDVYFSPAKNEKGTYETVYKIAKYDYMGKKACFLYGDTQEMAYAKLVFAYSFIDDPTERKKLILGENR